MAVRKFYFENSLGEKYYLTDENFKTFLNEPKGLGVSKSISTERFGTNKKVTSASYDIPQPSGELIFYDTDRAYQDYFDFIRFISYEPIRFYQIPANVVSPYYIDCEITRVEKSEISHDDGFLHCPIMIEGTSMWKTSDQFSITLQNEVSGMGKYYPLSYPYSYESHSMQDLTFFNNGTLPTGFILEVDGSTEQPYGLITNPILDAYDMANNKYGAMKLLGTFSYVRVNTNDNEQEIYLEDSQGAAVSNPVSCQDLSIVDGKTLITFYKLKVGQSKLSFNASNIQQFTGTVSIRWNNEFVTV